MSDQPLVRRWGRSLGGLAVLALVLMLGLFFFPWNVLREPANRYLSDRMGRSFAITRHLDVQIGRHLTVVADGIEVANPAWARDPYLLRAQAATLEIRLWPLLSGRLDMPRVSLQKPQLGLEMLADGRRTWALDRNANAESGVPQIGVLVVDQGQLHFMSAAEGADIRAEFALAPESNQTLPLTFKARGQWRGQALSAQGRTGGVLQLAQNTGGTFGVDISGTSGATHGKAQGQVTHLAALGRMNLAVELRGPSLADLHRLAGAVLPDTPPYRLEGRLIKDGPVWSLQNIKGLLGKTDLAGDLVFDLRPAIPRLSGQLQSRQLDFLDLGPLIGLEPPRRGTAVRTPQLAPDTARPGKVLPNKPLALQRLKAMNADVDFKALKVRNAQGLPLESISTRIQLDAGMLQLQPLRLGVAGGTLSGRLGINSHQVPPTIALRLDARALQLNRLFPRIETTKSSLGQASALIDLKGQGGSTAEMLASASGEVSLLMGSGQISNILLEYMGLDGGEIIKFLVRGDENVRLRCAAAAFQVERGLMSSRVILLDTVDTVVHGRGQISLGQETLQLILWPEPKDSSILSLRSPIQIGGTFGAPTTGPDKSALAGRAGLAVALAVINPLLALAATVETGPGEDANCGQVLKQAVAPPVSSSQSKPVR